MQRAWPLGLLAAARLGTAGVVAAKYGLPWNVTAFLVEGAALGVAAWALLRDRVEEARPKMALAFVIVAVAQAMLQLRNVFRAGASPYALGDLLFVAGFLVAAAGASRAAAAGVRFGFGLAALGAAQWLFVNLGSGETGLILTTSVAIAALVGAAWKLPDEVAGRPATAAA